MKFKKFLRDPFNLLGIFIVGLALLVAIPGYLITPDKTHHANLMALGISSKSPGFSCTFITDKYQEHSNIIHRWLHGNPPPKTFIPILSYKILEPNTIEYIEYGDENQIKKIASANLILKEKYFLLGTDRYGRDLLSRLIIGARISLLVGLISVFISLFIGTSIGMYAGYFRGNTDKIISWLIAVFWALPTLLIVMGLSFAFGKGFSQILLAIGLSTWVEVARVVRGQTLQLREKEFILSCKIAGFSSSRILWLHILPNLKGTLSVLATTNFASAILLEAGLSFLGLGIAPPMPTWGNMIQEHFGYLVLPSAHLALIPGAAIMILVTGFNFLSMGFRNLFDPYKRENASA